MAVFPDRFLAVALLGVAGGLAACCGRGAEPARVPRSTAGSDATAAADADPAPRSIPYDASESAVFRGADRAFLGRIVSVGPSPGIWSGIVATYQPVTFEVLRRLDDPDREGGPRGWPQPGTQVPVWFGIVGPPDCDRSAPRLDPRIYRVGAVGIVAADFGPTVVGGDGMEHHVDLRARTSFHEMDEVRTATEFPAGAPPPVSRPR